jgi:hypothetical protein
MELPTTLHSDHLMKGYILMRECLRFASLKELIKAMHISNINLLRTRKMEQLGLENMSRARNKTTGEEQNKKKERNPTKKNPK